MPVLVSTVCNTSMTFFLHNTRFNKKIYHRTPSTFLFHVPWTYSRAFHVFICYSICCFFFIIQKYECCTKVMRSNKTHRSSYVPIVVQQRGITHRRWCHPIKYSICSCKVWLGTFHFICDWNKCTAVCIGKHWCGAIEQIHNLFNIMTNECRIFIVNWCFASLYILVQCSIQHITSVM